MRRIFLKKGRERSVLGGHPWIFSGALEGGQQAHDNKVGTGGQQAHDNKVGTGGQQAHDNKVGGAVGSCGEGGGACCRGLVVGETVEVVSASGATLGYGSYSPLSQIRVRMLSFDSKTVPDAAFVEGLVAAAVGRRADFFVRGEMNALRLVNAESDGLPGVVADLYAGFAVCQFSSAGAEFWKKTVVAALMKFVPGCRGVSERTDLKDRVREGLEGRGERLRSTVECSSSHSNIQTFKQSNNSSVQPSTSNLQPSFRLLAGEEPPELIEIFEGSRKFLVDVRKGHKTGFYLDQRGAREAVGALANCAEVLNCFSYTGGFGIAAAACGALSVTQVDVSADALEIAKKNEMLQHACGTRFTYECEDVFQYLRRCRDSRRSFDLIVLDPPKFAETKSQVMKAARGYKDINLLAMKLLRPGGTLATFSCSGAMNAQLFDQVIAEAARDAGIGFQRIARTTAGADHPVSVAFPEGEYLKGVILRRI